MLTIRHTNTIICHFTYIPGHHAAIMNDFGEHVKVKWHFATIAFCSIHHDKIVVSAKFPIEVSLDANTRSNCASNFFSNIRLQSIPKLINCLQNWMCIHQHLIQTICGQLKVAFPRNGSFNYGHRIVKHFRNHVRQTQTFSIRGKPAIM